jgi:hypothetical protein
MLQEKGENSNGKSRGHKKELQKTMGYLPKLKKR